MQRAILLLSLLATQAREPGLDWKALEPGLELG